MSQAQAAPAVHPGQAPSPPRQARPAALRDYLRLARFDHVTKHVFILPGIAMALMLRGPRNGDLIVDVLLGSFCAFAIASANYVINEWKDRDFDKFHPTKSARIAVNVDLKRGSVYALWIGFTIAGLAAAALSSSLMLLVAALFWLQGVVYNIPPVRTKDLPFLDVLSESVNNPIRLLIGWAMIDASSLPPSSILIAYWLGGAFLMTAKRLSEYREITATHGKELLGRYRRSFIGYSEARLLTACAMYALLTVALFSVFLTKYRIEYLLLLPFLCILFSVYLGLSLSAGSVAQAPERLFGDRKLMVSVFLFGAAFGIFSFVEIPSLEVYTQQRFIELR